MACQRHDPGACQICDACPACDAELKTAREEGMLQLANHIRELLTADPTISRSRSPTQVRALLHQELRRWVTERLGEEATDTMAWAALEKR